MRGSRYGPPDRATTPRIRPAFDAARRFPQPARRRTRSRRRRSSAVPCRATPSPTRRSRSGLRPRHRRGGRGARAWAHMLHRGPRAPGGDCRYDGAMKRSLAAAFAALALSASAQDPRGEVLVYERADFAGRSVTLRDDMGNLALMGFDNRAASLYVLGGTWEFCTDAYFRGSCRLYGPGQHRNLGDQARRISSGRLVGTSI